jgi:hypothetical protein
VSGTLLMIHIAPAKKIAEILTSGGNCRKDKNLPLDRILCIPLKQRDVWNIHNVGIVNAYGNLVKFFNAANGKRQDVGREISWL